MKTTQKKWAAVSLALTGIVAANLPFDVRAEDRKFVQQTEIIAQESAPHEVVTEYADLWTGVIVFKTGEPVQWTVHVPEETELKGCSATIKIPGLGWGTEEKNQEENYLTLTQGNNLVYEFTPDAAGDYLFTCWMGAGCHSNYIHVTDDGQYAAETPADPTDLHAERTGATAVVSFTPPSAPAGTQITGYKVVATSPEGKRVKSLTKEASATLENLDEQTSYTIKVYTIATSGTSAGENEFLLEAVSETTTVSATTSSETQTTAVSTTAAAHTTTAKTSTTQAAADASNPGTGDLDARWSGLLLLTSFGLLFLTKKK